MLCPGCGANVGDTVQLCEKCESARLGFIEDQAQEELDREEEQQLPQSERLPKLAAEGSYAGLMGRAAAATIDFGAISIGASALLLLLAMQSLGPLAGGDDKSIFDVLWSLAKFNGVLYFVAMPYFVAFEGSELMATPGKLLLGLSVTDLDGSPIGFKRALYRHLAKGLSVITSGFGFLLCLTTQKKQTLHDGLVQTVVLDQKRTSPFFQALALACGCSLCAGALMLMQVSTEKAAEIIKASYVPPVPAPKNLLRFGAVEAKVPWSVALLQQDEGVVQIGYYPVLSESIDLLKVKAEGQIGSIEGYDPAVIISIRYSDPKLICKESAIERYSFVIYQQSGLPALPANPLRFELRAQDDELVAKGLSINLASVGCDPVDGGRLNASFKGFYAHHVGDEQMRVNWELGGEAHLLVPDAIKEVRYDGASTDLTAAVWEKSKGELSVGLFPSPLTEADLASIRQNHVLKTADGHTPDVSIVMSLKEGSTELSADSIKTSGLTFYRNGSMRLPGREPQISFFFVGVGKLSDLEGKLQEGENITGKSVNLVLKDLGNSATLFSWKIDFAVPIIDVDARPIQADSKRLPANSQSQVEKFIPAVNEPKASLTVDGAPYENESAIALFYPDTNKVSIGFFPFKLNEQDIEQLKRKKTFLSVGQERRISMAIEFDFAEGKSQVTEADILTYTTYVDRNGGIGAAGFISNNNILKVRKLVEQIEPGELKAVRGELGDNGKIYLDLKSAAEPRGSGIQLRWETKWTVPMIKVAP